MPRDSFAAVSLLIPSPSPRPPSLVSLIPRLGTRADDFPRDYFPPRSRVTRVRRPVFPRGGAGRGREGCITLQRLVLNPPPPSRRRFFFFFFSRSRRARLVVVFGTSGVGRGLPQRRADRGSLTWASRYPPRCQGLSNLRAYETRGIRRVARASRWRQPRE
jgi:hypothetical protein